MTKAELENRNRDRTICQIGFVYRDVKKAMKHWVECLGIGPWRIVSLSDVSVTNPTYFLDGQNAPLDEPFKIICAICNIGNMQFELIEPVYGPTIHQRFLDEKGEGLHHFKEKISPDRWEENLQEFAAKGMPVIFSGKYGNGSYAYVNTEEAVGFPLEFGDNLPNATFPEGSETWYYPED